MRDEIMNIGGLIVDFSINPRDKSDQTIDEFVEIMSGYKEKGYQFDESWNQPIEATEDYLVTKGSHSLLAALQVYGPQHQITVKIHEGISGPEEAAFLSATSNVHGKQYKPGERKKAVFQVLDQIQNLKNEGDPDKKPFMSIRDITEVTGVSKGYVFELRADYRAENGLPTEAGIILTVEELAEKREKQKKGKAPQEEPATPAVEEPEALPELSEEEMRALSTEELREYIQKKHGTPETEVSTDPVEEPAEKQAPGEPTVPSTTEEPEEPEETEEPEESEEEDDDEEPVISDEEAFEKYLAEQEPDGDLVDGSAPLVGKEIGDTDVIALTDAEILKKMTKERNTGLKPVRNLMDDFLRLSENEARESIDAYKAEIEFIRNDKGLWDPDVDPDLNGRDIVSSALLGLLDLMVEEHKSYAVSSDEDE